MLTASQLNTTLIKLKTSRAEVRLFYSVAHAYLFSTTPVCLQLQIFKVHLWLGQLLGQPSALHWSNFLTFLLTDYLLLAHPGLLNAKGVPKNKLWLVGILHNLLWLAPAWNCPSIWSRLRFRALAWRTWLAIFTAGSLHPEFWEDCTVSVSLRKVCAHPTTRSAHLWYFTPWLCLAWRDTLGWRASSCFAWSVMRSGQGRGWLVSRFSWSNAAHIVTWFLSSGWSKLGFLVGRLECRSWLSSTSRCAWVMRCPWHGEGKGNVLNVTENKNKQQWTIVIKDKKQTPDMSEQGKVRLKSNNQHFNKPRLCLNFNAQGANFKRKERKKIAANLSLWFQLHRWTLELPHCLLSLQYLSLILLFTFLWNAHTWHTELILNRFTPKEQMSAIIARQCCFEKQPHHLSHTHPS